MTEPTATPAPQAPVTVHPVCGNCCHFQKSTTEIGHGLCMALPPGCVFNTKGILVKTRPTLAANERGCTALFMPLPHLMALMEASVAGAANSNNGTLVTE